MDIKTGLSFLLPCARDELLLTDSHLLLIVDERTPVPFLSTRWRTDAGPGTR